MRKWSLLLSKASIREELLKIRSRISPEDRAFFSKKAAEYFVQSELFLKHAHFACYFSTEKELDTKPFIEAIWQANKKCYLPILLPKREEGLQFALYREDTKLKLNRYKILEPEHPEIFPTEKLDVVFLPLVAFDLKGNRIGMGAGYYDRTFYSLKKSSAKKPLLIGLGYDFQGVLEIPSDEWDVELDGVATNKFIKLFPRNLTKK